MSILRVGVVLLGIVAAAASATAPKTHEVKRSTTIEVGFDAAWTALIDLFAERNWTTTGLSKESGLIATDWLSLGDLADIYADCGGSGISVVRRTDIRFNVRMKPSGAGSTEISVNATFRQIRYFDGNLITAECNSRGTVETMIHDQITLRAGGARPPGPSVAPNPTNDPQLAVAYWCSTSDGVCSADESACVGMCHKTTDVWCARFTEGNRYGFLCSVSRTACLSLLNNPNHRKNRSDFGECVTRKASAVAATNPPPTVAPPSQPPPSTPRGFFCSSSTTTPSAGFCTREKMDCQRARDAALAAVAELAECALVETAYCFTAAGTERCAPTATGCTVRRAAAGSDVTSCDERR